MNRIMKIAAIAVLSVIVISLSFSAGCLLGPSSTSGTGSIDVVNQAWGYIFHDYVERAKLDATKLSQAAIEAIVKTIDDPHTAYLPPETYRESLNALEGKFEGIGAHVAMVEEKITIIAPIDGSPAEKAGIKAGDIILQIDGVDTADMSLEEAVLHIRGPAGNTVKLLVRHKDEEQAMEIEVVRAEIQLESVRLEMIDGYGYIRISQFTTHTGSEFAANLENMLQQSPKGIILDLLYNPGGVLSESVAVASHFITEGIVVSIVDNEGKQNDMNAIQTGPTTDLPMVVLVNLYSASASEVLAGALKDYNLAVLAGSTTFGKGSINIIRELSDGSALYITTARWYTPDGNVIEGNGIEPDYQIDPGEDAVQWAIDYLSAKQ
jgi:carboxyl-terminal processing protease